MVPENIGRYKILEQIGQGGMGKVYKALDTNLDRIVALKTLLVGQEENAIKRFTREAKAVAALQHPHIITLYDFDQADNIFFLTMDCVSGGSLKDLIEKKSLSPEICVDILLKILDAISYAHERGIIHRDLKPANILLDKNKCPYISDFGLVKVSQESTKISQKGAILGTPAYMSPEQANAGAMPVDQRSDLYSIGAIFYQMLTGKPPFESSTILSMLSKIMLQMPISPREIKASLPEYMERICLKAMAKDPKERYQNAMQMIDAIKNKEKPSQSISTSQDIKTDTAKSKQQKHKSAVTKTPKTKKVAKIRKKKATKPTNNIPALGVGICFLCLGFLGTFLIFGNSNKEQKTHLKKSKKSISKKSAKKSVSKKTLVNYTKKSSSKKRNTKKVKKAAKKVIPKKEMEKATTNLYELHKEMLRMDVPNKRSRLNRRFLGLCSKEFITEIPLDPQGFIDTWVDRWKSIDLEPEQAFEEDGVLYTKIKVDNFHQMPETIHMVYENKRWRYDGGMFIYGTRKKRSKKLSKSHRDYATIDNIFQGYSRMIYSNDIEMLGRNASPGIRRRARELLQLKPILNAKYEVCYSLLEKEVFFIRLYDTDGIPFRWVFRLERRRSRPMPHFITFVKSQR